MHEKKCAADGCGNSRAPDGKHPFCHIHEHSLGTGLPGFHVFEGYMGQPQTKFLDGNLVKNAKWHAPPVLEVKAVDCGSEPATVLAVKTHTHLLDGTRARCADPGCPVGC